MFCYLSCLSLLPIPWLLCNEPLTTNHYPPMTWLCPVYSPISSVRWFSKSFFPSWVQFFCLDLNVSQSLLKLFFYPEPPLGSHRCQDSPLCGVQLTSFSPSLPRVPLGPGSFNLSSRFCCALFSFLHSTFQPTAPPQCNTPPATDTAAELPFCIVKEAIWPTCHAVTPCK